MNLLHKILPVAQIVVSVALVILILLQERSSGLSGIFGGSGSDGGGYYQTRRGLENVIFIFTIVCIILFIGIAVLQLVF